MKKTLGGDRLGSGNKMQVAMHNYERSTHNLGNPWISTMAPGTLVPFYKKLALNGDTWSIDLNALVRTMPAVGPLFGAYKLQLDVFEVPIRLYNGILHNNWQKIGMDMSVAKMPTMELTATYWDNNTFLFNNPDEMQISSSSLLHYLGLKGIGGSINAQNYGYETITREFNAVPLLAYWDIWKNYYSNKQEHDGHFINYRTTTTYGTISGIIDILHRGVLTRVDNSNYENLNQAVADTPATGLTTNNYVYMIYPKNNPLGIPMEALLPTFGNAGDIIRLKTYGLVHNNPTHNVELLMYNQQTSAYVVVTNNNFTIQQNEDVITIIVNNNIAVANKLAGIVYTGMQTVEAEPVLDAFNLENIDDMRKQVLQITDLNLAKKLTQSDIPPYGSCLANDITGLELLAKNPMQGLAVKTYQSDYFNNWLSSEWVDYINNTTIVATTGGSFSMDALNLAQKMYNLKNRIAVAGGSYEDWQEAVWGEDALRRAESPMYCGGFSGTIAFEEVVSTADTDTAAAGDQPLGSLAGKGILVNGRHGHIEIHIKEPSYIIGIVSITPLINYSQGNDFDITDILTLNDLHKPELDQIGFQNLMLEKAAWWGKQWDSGNNNWVNHVVGKQPAWLDYMTSWGEIHGDFTDIGKLGYMVLGRHFEMGQALFTDSNVIGQPSPAQFIPVKDFTTYINPSKHNYQFANTAINAQNFWVQIGINAIVRRKMSAKLMPNI